MFSFTRMLWFNSIQVRYRKGPLSQKSAGHTQNRKTKTNTNTNRYRRRCPDPNARIQKFIHYMTIADLCDSGQLSPLKPCSFAPNQLYGTVPM